MVSVGPLLAVLLQLAGVFSEAGLAELEGLVAVDHGRVRVHGHRFKGLILGEGSLEIKPVLGGASGLLLANGKANS